MYSNESFCFQQLLKTMGKKKRVRLFDYDNSFVEDDMQISSIAIPGTKINLNGGEESKMLGSTIEKWGKQSLGELWKGSRYFDRKVSFRHAVEATDYFDPGRMRLFGYFMKSCKSGEELKKGSHDVIDSIVFSSQFKLLRTYMMLCQVDLDELLDERLFLGLDFPKRQLQVCEYMTRNSFLSENEGQESVHESITSGSTRGEALPQVYDVLDRVIIHRFKEVSDPEVNENLRAALTVYFGAMKGKFQSHTVVHSSVLLQMLYENLPTRTEDKQIEEFLNRKIAKHQSDSACYLLMLVKTKEDKKEVLEKIAEAKRTVIRRRIFTLHFNYQPPTTLLDRLFKEVRAAYRTEISRTIVQRNAGAWEVEVRLVTVAETDVTLCMIEEDLRARLWMSAWFTLSFLDFLYFNYVLREVIDAAGGFGVDINMFDHQHKRYRITQVGAGKVPWSETTVVRGRRFSNLFIAEEKPIRDKPYEAKVKGLRKNVKRVTEFMRKETEQLRMRRLLLQFWDREVFKIFLDPVAGEHLRLRLQEELAGIESTLRLILLPNDRFNIINEVAVKAVLFGKREESLNRGAAAAEAFTRGLVKREMILSFQAREQFEGSISMSRPFVSLHQLAENLSARLIFSNEVNMLVGHENTLAKCEILLNERLLDVKLLQETFYFPRRSLFVAFREHFAVDFEKECSATTVDLCMIGDGSLVLTGRSDQVKSLAVTLKGYLNRCEDKVRWTVLNYRLSQLLRGLDGLSTVQFKLGFRVEEFRGNYEANRVYENSAQPKLEVTLTNRSRISFIQAESIFELYTDAATFLGNNWKCPLPRVRFQRVFDYKGDLGHDEPFIRLQRHIKHAVKRVVEAQLRTLAIEWSAMLEFFPHPEKEDALLSAIEVLIDVLHAEVPSSRTLTLYIVTNRPSETQRLLNFASNMEFRRGATAPMQTNRWVCFDGDDYAPFDPYISAQIETVHQRYSVKKVEMVNAREEQWRIRKPITEENPTHRIIVDSGRCTVKSFGDSGELSLTSIKDCEGGIQYGIQLPSRVTMAVPKKLGERLTFAIQKKQPLTIDVCLCEFGLDFPRMVIHDFVANEEVPIKAVEPKHLCDFNDWFDRVAAKLDSATVINPQELMTPEAIVHRERVTLFGEDINAAVKFLQTLYTGSPTELKLFLDKDFVDNELEESDIIGRLQMTSGLEMLQLKNYQLSLAGSLHACYELTHHVSALQGDFLERKQYPATWKRKVQDNFQEMKLEPNSQEFYDVARLFYDSMAQTGKLLRICRMQNCKMWNRYKKKLEEKTAGNEMILFHGTRAVDPRKVLETIGDKVEVIKSPPIGKGRFLFSTSAKYLDVDSFYDPKTLRKVLLLARVNIGAELPAENTRTLKPGATESSQWRAIRLSPLTRRRERRRSLYLR